MGNWLSLTISGVCLLTVVALAPSTPRAETANLQNCMQDDPETFRDLIRLARERSTKDQRIKPLDLEEAQSACEVTNDNQAFPEEIALPMPCNRRMIFRRVVTGVGHPLSQDVGFFGDLVSNEGSAASKLSIAPWSAAVSGPFELSDGRRAYYIAKYETTLPQWKLFEAGLFAKDAENEAACAAYRDELAATMGADARPVAIPPAGELDWHQSVTFAKSYSTWLIDRDQALIAANEQPVLPWRRGSTGFVRLPTEAEWEYAARGGEAPREARSRHLPDAIDPSTGQRQMVENVEDIAFLSSVSTQSVLGGIGSKRANAIGVYDMLGNVEEITFDMFRMIRPDGLHGQPGGYLVRGGSSFTPRDSIGVALRREVPFHSASGAGGARVTGMRLVLSAPVFAEARSKEGLWRGGDLDQEFATAALSGRRQLTTGGDAERGGILQDVAALREEGVVTTEDIAQRLGELQARLEDSNARLAEAETAAKVDRAVAAMAIGWAVRQTGQRLHIARRQIQRVLERFEKENRPRAERRKVAEDARAGVLRIDAELNAQFEIYLDGVQDLAGLDTDKLQQILESATAKIAKRGKSPFGDAPLWLQSHVISAAERGGEIDNNMRRTWLFTVDEFRTRRETTFGPLE